MKISEALILWPAVKGITMSYNKERFTLYNELQQGEVYKVKLRGCERPNHQHHPTWNKPISSIWVWVVLVFRLLLSWTPTALKWFPYFSCCLAPLLSWRQAGPLLYKLRARRECLLSSQLQCSLKKTSHCRDNPILKDHGLSLPALTWQFLCSPAWNKIFTEEVKVKTFLEYYFCLENCWR